MLRVFGSKAKQDGRQPGYPGGPAPSFTSVPGKVDPPAESSGSFLYTLGWLSAGAGALGIGLVIGRELRQRYKFNRRTPYDVYAHAGDYQSDLEFGVGI